MSANDRTISLEARMDAQLRQFGYTNEQEQTGTSVPRMAARGAVAAGVGAGGYAAYKNRDAIKAAAIVGSAQAKKKAADLAATGMTSGKGLVKKGGMAVADQLAKGQKGGFLRKTAGLIKSSVKGLSRADVDVICHLAERIAALELEAAEDGVIEFKEYGPQRDPEAVRVTGAQTNGYFGGREALLARDKFQQSGHVYRKRDAAKDGIKGSLSGTGIALGALGGGVAASKGVMALAKSNKAPKGMLRKGVVKTAQVLKKAGRSKAVAIGGVLGASAAGNLAGLRIQRQSADKRLAKRQAEA